MALRCYQRILSPSNSLFEPFISIFITFLILLDHHIWYGHFTRVTTLTTKYFVSQTKSCLPHTKPLLHTCAAFILYLYCVPSAVFYLHTSEQLVWCLVVIFRWGRITSSCLSSATWHYLMFHTDTYKNGKIDIFHVPYLFFAVLSCITFKYLNVPKNQCRQ